MANNPNVSNNARLKPFLAFFFAICATFLAATGIQLGPAFLGIVMIVGCVGCVVATVICLRRFNVTKRP